MLRNSSMVLNLELRFKSRQWNGEHMLLATAHTVARSTHICLQIYPTRLVLLVFPLYRCGHRGIEGLSNLPKVREPGCKFSQSGSRGGS